MRATITTLLLITVASTPNALSQAQSGHPLGAHTDLPAGATVRVWSDHPPLQRQQAFVVMAGTDSLRLSIDYNHWTTPAAISYADLRRLEVRGTPSRAQGALRGFGYGLLTAIAVDAALAGFAGIKNDGDTDFAAALIGVVATPIIVIGGTVIGVAHPRNAWNVIYQR